MSVSLQSLVLESGLCFSMLMFSLREVFETAQLLFAHVDDVHTKSMEHYEILFLVNERNFVKTTVKFFVDCFPSVFPGDNYEQQVLSTGEFSFPIVRLSKLGLLERLNVLHRLRVGVMVHKLSTHDYKKIPNLPLSKAQPSPAQSSDADVALRLHAAMRRFKTTLAVFFRKSEKSPDALWTALSNIPIAVPSSFKLEISAVHPNRSAKKLRIGSVPDRGGVPDGYSKAEISRDVMKANLALKSKPVQGSNKRVSEYSSMFASRPTA